MAKTIFLLKRITRFYTFYDKLCAVKIVHLKFVVTQHAYNNLKVKEIIYFYAPCYLVVWTKLSNSFHIYFKTVELIPLTIIIIKLCKTLIEISCLIRLIFVSDQFQILDIYLLLYIIFVVYFKKLWKYIHYNRKNMWLIFKSWYWIRPGFPKLFSYGPF